MQVIHAPSPSSLVQQRLTFRTGSYVHSKGSGTPEEINISAPYSDYR